MSKPQRNLDFFEDWQRLKKVTEVLLTEPVVSRSQWNEGFRIVYEICVAKNCVAGRLYDETKKLIEAHLKIMLRQLQKEEIQLSSYYLLWNQYSQGTILLNTMYFYLNTRHIRKQSDPDAELLNGILACESSEQMKEIGELGLDLWKKMIIEPLSADLIRLLLDAIICDRTGTSTYNEKSSTIQGVIHSFVSVTDFKKENSLEFYETMFEKPFLEATGAYYKLMADRLLQECTISQYMEKVLQLCEEEDFRSRKFLNPTSYGKVRVECEQRMVADHLSAIHNELPAMVQHEMHQDLRNAFALLKDDLSVLVQQVQEHIKQQGLK